MMMALAGVALFFAAFPALLYFRNVTLYRTPAVSQEPPVGVSVLIPARNEEAGIEEAVMSALTSQGVNLEVVVLDDHSEDRTAEIVQKIALTDNQLRLESAPPLPEGWCGKQHACHVLAGLARYDLLVFVDADVRLTSDGLSRMVGFIYGSKTDLVSGIPRQRTGTLLEKQLIPLIHFLLLGFLPIARMRTSGQVSLGAGCGQLFMATRRGYDLSGGHAAIRRSLHDGLTLPRAFRKAGLMTDLFDATEVASCRMYHSASQVWFGLAKNAREGLASNRLIVPATVMLLSGQVLPVVLLGWLSTEEWIMAAMVVVAVVCSLAPRIDAAIRFKQSLWAAFFNPLSVSLVILIQWFALFRDVLGFRPSWKGRQYANTAVTSPSSGPGDDSPSQ
ncbi:glycosyltransferase family 2 protein [Zavarzinella formosa]|uniref:glycosyltransferase family 2 protein n=1 Tax=Zavarzinella formosa TaxID=360055 RepID=UPI000303D6D0|nr:glycosyltransferase family 2 protein [Zavarzinella formosa]